MLPEHAVEPGADPEQRTSYAQVASVGLELDPHQARALERVLEQQKLGLDVRARAPVRPLEPRPADLRAPVERLDVHVPGRPHRSAADVNDERNLGLRSEGGIEPTVEAE